MVLSVRDSIVSGGLKEALGSSSTHISPLALSEVAYASWLLFWRLFFSIFCYCSIMDILQSFNNICLEGVFGFTPAVWLVFRLLYLFLNLTCYSSNQFTNRNSCEEQFGILFSKVRWNRISYCSIMDILQNIDISSFKNEHCQRFWIKS